MRRTGPSKSGTTGGGVINAHFRRRRITVSRPDAIVAAVVVFVPRRRRPAYPSSRPLPVRLPLVDLLPCISAVPTFRGIRSGGSSTAVIAT